jgi:hypothetical protein
MCGFIFWFSHTVRIRRENQVSCSNIVEYGIIPPSVMVSSGAKISVGSTSSIIPSPLQSGQAPWGELKEKVLGSISGSWMLSLGQENFSEKRWSVKFLGFSGNVNPESRT